MSTGTKPSSAGTTTAASGSGGDANWLPVAITVLISLVLAVLFVFLFGNVTGEEFNPYTFQRQKYRYVLIPFTKIQVRGTTYKDTTTNVQRSIATILGKPLADEFVSEDFGDDADKEKDPKKTTQQKKSGPDRWDIVYSSRAFTKTWSGDAKLMTDSLDIRDHKGDELWQAWTTDHPKAAKVLWPVVARTAQANMYLVIPALLETATNQTDAKKLQSELKAVVINESTELGKLFAENEDHYQALQAYELVRTYDPNSVIAKQGAQKARAAIAAEKAAEKPAPSEASQKSAETKTSGTDTSSSATPQQEPPPAEVDSEFE